MNKQNNRILINNTIYMYILSFAKLIIPLLSLPYLTKVLSVECFGSVSFVKSFVSYVQIIIDFGFLFSATKDIVGIIKNKGNVSREVGSTLYAQLILSIIAIIGMLVFVLCFDILEGYELFAMLSVMTAVLSIFLFEYVFRAYEQMGKISLRYVIMRLIALVLTLVFVKSDSDIILIPIFDILASIIAIVMVVMQLKRLGVGCEFSFRRIKDAWSSIKKSFLYFFANFMSTAYSLLNTIIIGVMLTKTDIAYWTVAMQFLTAVQSMYTPIVNSVYPAMLKNKSLKVVNKIMLIYMPVILLGNILTYFLSDWLVTLVFIDDYIYAGVVIRYIIPVIICSFPAMLYAWPCMSVINKEKTNIAITIIGAFVQIIGIVVIVVGNIFTLINLAIIRGVTELIVATLRIIVVYKNKKLYEDNIKDIHKVSTK